VDAKNVVQVQIFGHSYTIRGEAERDYIMGVAAYVDQKIR
jgi:cell division protein ZapA (FtsZ GTPase activity inhibitor)